MRAVTICSLSSLCTVAVLLGCAGQPAPVPEGPIASPGPVGPIAPTQPAASYTFELLALDAEGNLNGTPRPVNLTRVGAFPKKGRTAETAAEPVTTKCPALVNRLGRYEVSNADKGVDIWLGIAASTDEDARAALRELTKCGAKSATLEKLPADS